MSILQKYVFWLIIFLKLHQTHFLSVKCFNIKKNYAFYLEMFLLE